MAEEITHENFGALDPVRGGLGARGRAVVQDKVPNDPNADGGADSRLGGAGSYSPKPHGHQPVYKDYQDFVD